VDAGKKKGKMGNNGRKQVLERSLTLKVRGEKGWPAHPADIIKKY